MSTIITVHGTFAHLPGSSLGSAAGTGGQYWWQSRSAFQQELKRLVVADDGEVSFHNFEWSGDNSERARREAASRLLDVFRELEERGERYCAIGHSHGGSVISQALLQSVAKNVSLEGLQKWMTVGTPFIELRKERFLFLRLPVILKAMFVASGMLLFMFAFYVIAQIFAGRRDFADVDALQHLAFAGLLATLPFAVFYLVSKISEMRTLWPYRRRVIETARAQFAEKWIALNHRDDEALQGLSSLNSVKFNIFHRDFAVSALTAASVFLLPVLYLYLVLSPSVMTGLADYLAKNVYDIQDFEKVEGTYRADRRELANIRGKIRTLESEVDRSIADTGKVVELRGKIGTLRKELGEARRSMSARYDDTLQVHRAARFKKRFLEINGQGCPAQQLCYGGRDIALNGELLYHIVTDEFSSLVFDSEVRYSGLGRIFRIAIPILLVPLVFGLVAVAIVGVIQFLARYVSVYVSYLLDDLTWQEVRRSALGNDTEAEVAVAALRRPSWIVGQPSPLPVELSDAITQKSNAALAASLGKVRSAISELAFSDQNEDKSATVLNYLNWQELIHTAYFEVPEFRHLVALAVSHGDGFNKTAAFDGDPNALVFDGWLKSLSDDRAENA